MDHRYAKQQLRLIYGQNLSEQKKLVVPILVCSFSQLYLKSAAGNWFADVLLHAYDEALCMKGLGGADAVLICAGCLRGDSVYGPGMFSWFGPITWMLSSAGVVTLGDIIEVLPFDDSIVVLEVSGSVIWEALESSLKTWPAHEGYVVYWENSRNNIGHLTVILTNH